MARLGRCALLGVAAAVAGAGCGGGGHPASTRSVASTTATSTATSPGIRPVAPPPTTVPARPSVPTPTTAAPRAEPTSTTVGSTTTTSPSSAVQAALVRLTSGLPTGRYAVSDVQVAGGRTFVVVGRDVSTRQSVIDVDVYAGGSFQSEVSGIGEGQDLDPVAPGPIASARITTSAVPDFLLQLQGSQTPTGVLLSDVGGGWHLVGLEDRSGAAASDEIIQPHLSGPYVTQAIAVCAPNCSQGPYSMTTYGYDAGTGELAQVGPAVQSPTPG